MGEYKGRCFCVCLSNFTVKRRTCRHGVSAIANRVVQLVGGPPSTRFSLWQPAAVKGDQGCQ